MSQKRFDVKITFTAVERGAPADVPPYTNTVQSYGGTEGVDKEQLTMLEKIFIADPAVETVKLGMAHCKK